MSTLMGGKVVRVVLALLYALMLSRLPLEGLPDRQNYLAMATDLSWTHLGRFFFQGFGSLLTNEPLWRLINGGLSGFLEAETIVRGFVFFNVYLASYIIFESTRKNPLWAVVIVFSPFFLINQAIQLRQGLATAIFLYAWVRCTGRKQLVIYIFTPLIHASFFFVVFIIFFRWFCVRFKLPIYAQCVLWGGAAICLGLISMSISGSLGARQADRYTVAADVSGLAFLFWLFVLSIMMSSGSSWIKRHWFSVYIVIFYVGAYWFLPVVARVLESGLVLVLLSIADLKRLKRYSSYLLLFLFLYSGYFTSSTWLLFWI